MTSRGCPRLIGSFVRAACECGNLGEVSLTGGLAAHVWAEQHCSCELSSVTVLSQSPFNRAGVVRRSQVFPSSGRWPIKLSFYKAFYLRKGTRLVWPSGACTEAVFAIHQV